MSLRVWIRVSDMGSMPADDKATSIEWPPNLSGPQQPSSDFCWMLELDTTPLLVRIEFRTLWLCGSNTARPLHLIPSAAIRTTPGFFPWSPAEEAVVPRFETAGMRDPIPEGRSYGTWERHAMAMVPPKYLPTRRHTDVLARSCD